MIPLLIVTGVVLFALCLLLLCVKSPIEKEGEELMRSSARRVSVEVHDYETLDGPLFFDYSARAERLVIRKFKEAGVAPVDPDSNVGLRGCAPEVRIRKYFGADEIVTYRDPASMGVRVTLLWRVKA